MNWFNIAIVSAGVHGMVNIIDNHLLSRRMPSLGSFLLPIAIIHLTYGYVVFVIFPFPDGLSAWPLGVAIASGILRTGAITIMLYTMTREEVSRVIPVVYTYPIFVAIMGVVLLDEELLCLHWLAVVMVVTGAVLVSLKRDSASGGVWLGKSFHLLLVSSLLMAGADVASKYALAYISFWNMYSLAAFCMSSFFLLLSMRPRVLQELRSMERLGSTMALLAFNEILAPIGIILSFWAIERGPVSLVSTIIGCRPVFVFIYSLVLVWICPGFLGWHPTRAILALRLLATVMIVSGVAMLHLL